MTWLSVVGQTNSRQCRSYCNHTGHIVMSCLLRTESWTGLAPNSYSGVHTQSSACWSPRLWQMPPVGQVQCLLEWHPPGHWDVAQCSICQEEAASQQKEPLKQKDKPPRPWHTISADFFDLGGKQNRLVADHFSKFTFVKQMPWDCSSLTTQAYCKELFSTQGVPEILYTDNGPQFTAFSFADFCKERNVRHITSSPHYPQLNGFIESMVKIIKRTLRKAYKDNMDPQMALLCLHTTPISNRLPSPNEMFMGRKAKSNLPITIQNTLTNHDSMHKELEMRKEKQKTNFDAHAGPTLLHLHLGQAVRIQNHSDGPTVHGLLQKWWKSPPKHIRSFGNT